MASVASESVPPVPVTEASLVVQVPSPEVPVDSELRSVLPMNDREEMPEASAARHWQCSGLNCVDLAAHDRNPAHAHAGVWLWRFQANQPCGWDLDSVAIKTQH